MRPRPVVRQGRVEVRDMMYLSLSFDHRVIDGAVGAAFTYEVIQFLEEPDLLMLELR
jgi:pyruvate dehydrogenase E2 component (dihydrolipoamide acetyltransferase)